MLYNNAAMSDLGQGYWTCREVGGTHTKDTGEKDKSSVAPYLPRNSARFWSPESPFLLQQFNNQLVHIFLSQQNNRHFLFLTELTDLFVAGRDQSAADQQSYLAEGHPPLEPL